MILLKFLLDLANSVQLGSALKKYVFTLLEMFIILLCIKA